MPAVQWRDVHSSAGYYNAIEMCRVSETAAVQGSASTASICAIQMKVVMLRKRHVFLADQCWDAGLWMLPPKSEVSGHLTGYRLKLLKNETKLGFDTWRYLEDSTNAKAAKHLKEIIKAYWTKLLISKIHQEVHCLRRISIMDAEATYIKRNCTLYLLKSSA